MTRRRRTWLLVLTTVAVLVGGPELARTIERVVVALDERMTSMQEL